jgi:RNA recognition motif-containing protein
MSELPIDFSDVYSARGVICPKSVFVGDLSADTTGILLTTQYTIFYYTISVRLQFNSILIESDIATALSFIGTPVQIVVKRSKVTRQTLGYGFVEFSTEEESRAAVDADRVMINGRSAKISWAYRNCTLHVSNLLTTVTEEDLSREFSQFGELFPEDTVIFRPGELAL